MLKKSRAVYMKKWRSKNAKINNFLTKGSDIEQGRKIFETQINENLIQPLTPFIPNVDIPVTLNNLNTSNEHNSSVEALNAGFNDWPTEPINAMNFESNSTGTMPPSKDLRNDLAKWATNYTCSRSALNELLEILHQHGHQDQLPLDARTLLGTPRQINTIEKCGGQYIYFSFK